MVQKAGIVRTESVGHISTSEMVLDLALTERYFDIRQACMSQGSYTHWVSLHIFIYFINKIIKKKKTPKEIISGILSLSHTNSYQPNIWKSENVNMNKQLEFTQFKIYMNIRTQLIQ